MTDLMYLYGDFITVMCWVEDNSILRFVGGATVPVPGKFEARSLEVVGRHYRDEDSTYTYAVVLPPGSRTGLILPTLSNGTILDDTTDFDRYQIDFQKHGGKTVGFVWQEDVLSRASVPPVSGMKCMNRFCKEEAPYASGANCPNNVFLCYSCKHNPMTYAVVMAKFAGS